MGKHVTHCINFTNPLLTFFHISCKVISHNIYLILSLLYFSEILLIFKQCISEFECFKTRQLNKMLLKYLWAHNVQNLMDSLPPPKKKITFRDDIPQLQVPISLIYVFLYMYKIEKSWCREYWLDSEQLNSMFTLFFHFLICKRKNL